MPYPLDVVIGRFTRRDIRIYPHRFLSFNFVDFGLEDVNYHIFIPASVRDLRQIPEATLMALHDELIFQHYDMLAMGLMIHPDAVGAIYETVVNIERLLEGRSGPRHDVDFGWDGGRGQAYLPGGRRHPRGERAGGQRGGRRGGGGRGGREGGRERGLGGDFQPGSPLDRDSKGGSGFNYWGEPLGPDINRPEPTANPGYSRFNTERAEQFGGSTGSNPGQNGSRGGSNRDPDGRAGGPRGPQSGFNPFTDREGDPGGSSRHDFSSFKTFYASTERDGGARSQFTFGEEGFREPPAPSESATPDLYAVLGVPRNASTADIQKAFKNKIMTYHPDKAPKDDAAQEQAKKKTADLNLAREILTDSEKRERYDDTGRVDEPKEEDLFGAQGWGRGGGRGFGGNPDFERNWRSSGGPPRWR
ncbi:DnaJ-domain-containing protein [Amniculicola lignicola CBS 123094]|uniref:DnaJ-domain-containing protein n=1 Tax=Amniculicola lignicola CBS 123094 TaxID=1392246 RepID=A0A6A5W8P8_9PLEO|nr:DnaJ-domain-containing protein [Amniculicola lignicola CBS 123094]